MPHKMSNIHLKFEIGDKVKNLSGFKGVIIDTKYDKILKQILYVVQYKDQRALNEETSISKYE